MFRWTMAALAGAALLCSGQASADAAKGGDKVTRDQAVARALAASFALKSREELVAGADAGVRQGGVLPNPEVNVELENIAGSGAFQNLDQSELTVGIEQRIERGGKRSGRVAVAAAERDLAETERDKTRFDAVLEARRAFYDVCAAQVALRLHKSALDNATQLEAMARRRVAAARDPVTVRLRAEIQTATARGHHERAGRTLEAAKKKLANLWGTPDVAFQADETDFLAIPEQDIASDAAASPVLRAREAAVRRAAAKIELEEANAGADISVGLGIRRFEVGGDVAGVLSLSMPIALWDSNQANIERAAAERRAADLDALEAKRIAEDEVLTLKTDAKNASAEATALRKELLPRAEESLRAARRGYQLGAFSYLEVSESMRTLQELRVREVDVLRTLHVARAALERYAGGLAEETVKGKEQ